MRLRFPGDYPFRPYERRWATVSCDRCAAGVTRAGLDGTEEGAAKDAAEAWNIRAERTCRKLPADTECVCIVRNHGLVREFGYWKCSECGVNCFEGARYCMGCGAKVVEE